MREAIEEILRRQEPTGPAEAPTSSQILFPTLAGETEANQLPSDAGRDLTNCKIVKAVKGAGAASQCYQNANQRNFECRQYGPGGVRKQLYGW